MSLVLSNILTTTNYSHVDNNIWSQTGSPIGPAHNKSHSLSLSIMDHLVNNSFNSFESSDTANVNTSNTTNITTLQLDTILTLLSTSSILDLIRTIYSICATILSTLGLLLNLFIVWIIIWQKRLTTNQAPTNLLLLQLALTGITFSFLIILDLVQWPTETITTATKATTYDDQLIAVDASQQPSLLTATMIDLNDTSNNNYNNDYATTTTTTTTTTTATTNKLLNIIISPQSSHKNITTISNCNITTNDNDDDVIENIIHVRSNANLTPALTIGDPSQQQLPSSLFTALSIMIASLMPLFISMFQTVHIWTVAALSIDRYCAISNPLHYLRFVYAKRTIAFIIFAWTLSLTLNVIVPITLDQFTTLSANTFTKLDNNNINNDASRRLVRAQQLLADHQGQDNEPPIVLNSILTSSPTADNYNNKLQHNSRNIVIPPVKAFNHIDVSDNREINRKALLDNNVNSQEQSADLGDEYDVECFGSFNNRDNIALGTFDDPLLQQSTFKSMAALWSPSKSVTQWLWIDHKLAQASNNHFNRRGPTNRKLIKCSNNDSAHSMGSNSMKYTHANSTVNIGLSAKEASRSNEIPKESQKHQRHIIMIKLTLYSTTCLILVILVPLMIIILCNIHIYYIAKNHKSRMLTNSGRSNKQTPTPSFSGANHIPSHHYDLEANRELSLASKLAKKRQLLTRLSSSQSLTTTTATVPTINEKVGHHQVVVPSNNSNQLNSLLSTNSYLSKRSRPPVMRASSLQDDSLIPVGPQFSLTDETNEDHMHRDLYQQLCQDYSDFTVQSQQQQHHDSNLATNDAKPDERLMSSATSQKHDDGQVQQVVTSSRATNTSPSIAKNDAFNRRYYPSRQSSSSSIQLPNCTDQSRHKCCRRTNSRASLISASHSVKLNNNSRQQSIVSFSDNLPTYTSDHQTANRDALDQDTNDKTMAQSQLSANDKLGTDRMRSTKNGSLRHERNCISLLVNHPSHQSPVNHTNHYGCHQHNLRNHYNDVDSIAHNLKIAGLTLAGIKSDKCLRENHYQNRVHQYHAHCPAKMNSNHSNCMCACYDCTIYSYQSYSHTSSSSLNYYPLLLGGMTAGVIAAPQGSSCGFSQVATSVGVRKHDAFSAVIYLILGLLLFGLPHYILVSYAIIKSPLHSVLSNEPLSNGLDEEKWFAILSTACRLLFIAMIPVNAWLYGIRSRSLRSTMRRVLHRYISRRQASIEISRRRKSSPSIRSRDSSSFKKGSSCAYGYGNFWSPSNQKSSSQNIPTLMGQCQVCDCRRAHSCCTSIMEGAFNCLSNASQSQCDSNKNCFSLAEHRTVKSHEKSCAKRRNFLFRNSSSPLNPFAVLHSLAMKLVDPDVAASKSSKSNNSSLNQDCNINENVCSSNQMECAHHKQSATQSSMPNMMKKRDSCCQSTKKQISNQQSEEDCSCDLIHVATSTPDRFQHISATTESSAGSTADFNRDDDQMLTLLLKKTRSAKAARLQRCLAINQSDLVSSKFKKTASDDRWAASDHTSDSSRRVSSASTLESSLVLSTASTKCQCNCTNYHIQDCLMTCHQKFQQLPLSEQTSNSTTATTVYQQSQHTPTVIGRKYSGCNCQSVSRRCSTIHNPQLSFDSPQKAYNENDIHVGSKQRTSIDSEYAFYNENLGDTDMESQFDHDNKDSNLSSDTQNVLAKIGFGFGLGFGIGFGHCSSSNSKSDLKETKRSWRTRHSIPSTDSALQVDEQERLALLNSTQKQSYKHTQTDTTSKLDLDPQDFSRMRTSKINQRRRHSHSHCDSSPNKRNGSIQLETIRKSKLDPSEQGHDDLKIKITSHKHESASENDACRAKKNDLLDKYSEGDERRAEAVDNIKKMLILTLDRSKQCGYSTSIIENNPSCLRTNHNSCNTLSNHKDDGNIKNNSCRANHEKTTASTRYPSSNIDGLNIKGTMNENYSTLKPMTTDCKWSEYTKDLQCSNKNSSPQDEMMKSVTQNTVSTTTTPNKCDTVVSYEDNSAIYTSISLKIKERRKSEIEPAKITIDTKKPNIPSAINLMLAQCSPIEVSEFSADSTSHQIEPTSLRTLLQSAEQNNNIVGKQTISNCIVVPKFLAREIDRTTDFNRSKSRLLVGPYTGHNGLNLEQRTLAGYGATKTSVNSLLNAINIMTSQSTKDDKPKVINDSIKDKENACSHDETKANDLPVECRSSNHRLLPPTTIQLSCVGGSRQIITNTLLSPIREGSANHSCASSQTSLDNSSILNLN